MTHRSDIQPIVAPACAEPREIRVEVTTDLTYIHITPAAVCSHCGHEACLFVACDGWSPCARCHRLLGAQKPAQAPPNAGEYYAPPPSDPITLPMLLEECGVDLRRPYAAEILRRADEMHRQLAVDSLAERIDSVLRQHLSSGPGVTRELPIPPPGVLENRHVPARPFLTPRKEARA